jgi:hypothetical protein
MSRSILLLPLSVFMAWTGTNLTLFLRSVLVVAMCDKMTCKLTVPNVYGILYFSGSLTSLY